MRLLRRAWLGVVCLGSLWLVGLCAAEAQPRHEGRAAAELHVLGVHGGPSPSIQGLRGRWVLLELFRTECPHCQEAVPHLNDLQQARFERGLRVIGLGFEPVERLKEFHVARKLAYPVAQVDLEIFRDYGVTALPTAVLVDPHGVVAWWGVPARLTLADVDRHMAASPPWPSLPPALDPPADLLRRDELGAAREALQSCAARVGCSPAEASAATALLAWIERHVTSLRELARRDVHQALRAWAVLADGLGDSAAAAEREALRADTVAWNEAAAGAALSAARAQWRTSGREAGLAALDAVATTYPGSRAGIAAAALAARLRKRS